MIFVFYALAAVLVWLSAKSFFGGIRYLQYFKAELAKPRPEFTPFVSVIVPCRGVDDGLGGHGGEVEDHVGHGAIGELAHGFHDVDVAHHKGVGGAEVPAQLQLLVV